MTQQKATSWKVLETVLSHRKVYMTDFFLFARLNLPNVLISVAKKIFRWRFFFLTF